jgi:hypothetical protein
MGSPSADVAIGGAPSGREQRRVRKVVALRMKAMSYRP